MGVKRLIRGFKRIKGGARDFILGGGVFLWGAECIRGFSPGKGGEYKGAKILGKASPRKALKKRHLCGNLPKGVKTHRV